MTFGQGLILVGIVLAYATAAGLFYVAYRNHRDVQKERTQHLSVLAAWAREIQSQQTATFAMLTKTQARAHEKEDKLIDTIVDEQTARQRNETELRKRELELTAAQFLQAQPASSSNLSPFPSPTGKTMVDTTSEALYAAQRALVEEEL